MIKIQQNEKGKKGNYPKVKMELRQIWNEKCVPLPFVVIWISHLLICVFILMKK